MSDESRGYVIVGILLVLFYLPLILIFIRIIVEYCATQLPEVSPDTAAEEI